MRRVAGGQHHLDDQQAAGGPHGVADIAKDRKALDTGISVQAANEGRLTHCSGRPRQIGARPPARFGARRKRTEINHGNAAKGTAAVRVAMRYNVVACGGGFPSAAVPSSKELDRGIDIVAGNGARTPGSHDPCQSFPPNDRRASAHAFMAAATASHYPMDRPSAVQNGTAAYETSPSMPPRSGPIGGARAEPHEFHRA